ncbi:MAG: GyrI-like domain-containing protein, partial [Anaerolineae bacterium]|nr:GyrI-like domain-containing protein [Anaerolineae bacterium]
MTPDDPTLSVPSPDHVDADHAIGETRIMTVPEVRYFRVTVNAPFDKLDEVLDPLIVKLEQAQGAAGIAALGPVIVRYFQTGEPGMHRMDIGVPVRDDVAAAGDAEIEVLPSIRCGALLFWGSLAYIGDAYGALIKGIAEAGLTNRGEGREWHLHFEGDTSPNNVIMLQLEAVDA